MGNLNDRIFAVIDASIDDALGQFRDAMQEVFGRLDWLPEPDARIHRFHVPGDRSGTKNGWYVMFPDGIPAGEFGSWKTGITGRWRSREPVDYREENLLRERYDSARRQRDAELLRVQQAASSEAQKLWGKALPAKASHPYLRAKGVCPHELRQLGGQLLVPLIQKDRLVSLQFITPDGFKRFLPGGRVKGCYTLFGAPSYAKELYLCEGWATGATIHEYSGAAVACAMNAGNLLEAGKQLRLIYPGAELIIAADDDRMTEGNPGLAAAILAAKELGCRFTYPKWTGSEPLHMSDFNDFYRVHGRLA